MFYYVYNKECIKNNPFSVELGQKVFLGGCTPYGYKGKKEIGEIAEAPLGMGDCFRLRHRLGSLRIATGLDERCGTTRSHHRSLAWSRTYDGDRGQLWFSH